MTEQATTGTTPTADDPAARVQDPELMNQDVDPAAPENMPDDATTTDPSSAEGVVTAGPGGAEVPEGAEPSDAAVPTSTLSDEDVYEALKDVVDPELGINVVDLGLIYGVNIDDHSNVVVDMTLTSAACPLTDMIEDQAHTALEGMANEMSINWVWMPPWTAAKITDDGRDQLRAMGFNV